MKNKTNIAHWVFTGLLCALMLFSASMYLFNYDHVQTEFIKLGFPIYIIYPLAVAKIVGVIALLQTKIAVLKEWAYAAFFFELLLALSSHLVIKDGEHVGALIGLVLFLLSYYFYKKQ